MAGPRKRKHASFEEQPSKPKTTNKVQQGIKAFGDVRKQEISEEHSKRRKTVHHREPTPPPALKAHLAKPVNRRKRTLESVQEEEHLEVDSARRADIENETTRVLVSREIATPRNKRFKTVHPLSPIETPSKSAAALFHKLKLDASSIPIPFAFSTSQQAYSTPPDTPQPNNPDPDHIPTELNDLLQLQASFLSAMSMFYAHNGTSSRVTVKALLPMITKHWKKRSVSLDDLRVLLAMDPGSDPSFVLQDSGKAGICLVKAQPRGRATKRAASYVDEVDLKTRFENALRTRWMKWLAATPIACRDATIFLNQLPQADITKDGSVNKAAPMFARGQQRLADLKASQAFTKLEPTASSAVNAVQKTNHAVLSRGTNLLDRIIAKQAHSASLPAGPTKDQLDRKAALQRVEEIARVLDLLAGGRPRCSFSMPAMIQHLQQSLRNPLSKEEVERCLGLMAKEITPRFVNLLQSGALTGVVITKSGKIGLDELRERVLNAGA